MDVAAVVLALLSALCYGCGDFALGVASRANTVFGTSCAFQILGLPAPAIAIAITRPAFPSHAALIDGALGGVCLGVGGVAFVAALAKGHMGVITPLAAIGTAGVPVAVGLIGGDRLTALSLAGIVIALVGLVAITADGSGQWSARGLGEGSIAALAFGGYFVFLRAGQSGGWWTVEISRLVVVVAAVAVAVTTKRSMTVTRRSVPTVIIAATFAAGAAATFLFAQRGGALSLTSVLASLYPAVTTVLAAGFLKERLALRQYAGAAMVLTAAACISAA